MAFYKINPDKDLTVSELQVRREGYRFVSTTELKSGKAVDEHSHHGENTHLIVRGSMSVEKVGEEGPILRALQGRAGDHLVIRAGLSYHGEAGPYGCVFIEGHRALSPASTKRFFERGDIVEAAESDEGSYASSSVPSTEEKLAVQGKSIMQGFNMGRAPNFDNQANKKRPPGTLRKDGTQTVRFEMPFAVWCHHCKPHAIIGQGVRFNAEKSKVGYYYSTPIWNFKLKHAACGGLLEIRTDPKNTAYVVTEGGKARDYGDSNDKVREGEDGRPILTAEEREARRQDAFARLEDRVEEKAAVKLNTKRITELYRARERDWDDPWEANKRVRTTFRRERKVRKREAEADEAVKERLGTAIELLPESVEDIVGAKLVTFGGQQGDDAASKAMFDNERPTRSPSILAKKSGGKELLRQLLVGNTRAVLNPFGHDLGTS